MAGQISGVSGLFINMNYRNAPYYDRCEVAKSFSILFLFSILYQIGEK